VLLATGIVDVNPDMEVLDKAIKVLSGIAPLRWFWAIDRKIAVLGDGEQSEISSNLFQGGHLSLAERETWVGGRF
jgi:hypothetical protein